jgi:phosphopantothenoylcysteine decarboxylase
VAAVRVPALFDALTAAGHAVKVVATSAATYFFDPAPLRAAGVLVLDEDEWPGRAEGGRYERGDSVMHIELRKWADIFAIAPLDANTLAKLAVGLCDNCLTCVWRAWDIARPVVLAPAMNTLMWQHPFTRRHLRSLAADAGAGHIPAHLSDDALVQQINDRSSTLRIVGPITKALACGDTGIGAMAEVADVVAAVQTMLARAQAA